MSKTIMPLRTPDLQKGKKSNRKIKWVSIKESVLIMVNVCVCLCVCVLQVNYIKTKIQQTGWE